MKPSTGAIYHDRIKRVVGFLNDQVNSNPTLETLADVAAISPFHFHRVYRAVTGETPSATLRRLRLARACYLLQDADRLVADVAFAVGYDSSQSFAKAFRAATGCSATELRKDEAALANVMQQLSAPEEASAAVRPEIEVKVVSVEPFRVIASRHLGPHKGLFSAYGDLFAWAEQTGLLAGFKGIYGIPVDDPGETPEQQCRFDCCVDLGADAKGADTFREKELGGGDFAVVRHVGPYEGLEQKYDYLYGPWLASSGYELREQTLFNHYLQDPETVPPEEWQTDVYLPVNETS